MDDEIRYWTLLDLVYIKHEQRAENLFRITKEDIKIPDEFIPNYLNSEVVSKIKFGGLTEHVRRYTSGAGVYARIRTEWRDSTGPYATMKRPSGGLMAWILPTLMA